MTGLTRNKGLGWGRVADRVCVDDGVPVVVVELESIKSGQL